MSKSKLNRRQLKKISKLAVNYLVRARYGWMTGISWEDVSFGEMESDCYEYVIWYRSDYWIEGYDYVLAIAVIFANFHDKFEEWEGIDINSHPNLNTPESFNGLSFANRVHYIIKFLEASNEQCND